MRLPRSLQARLGLSLGILLTVLWIAAASVTTLILRQEMDEIFDFALQETAQRLLPLAVVDIVGRDDDGIAQRLGVIREHDEFFTYIVRDAQGRILLQSHSADPAVFPAYDGPGFRQTATHRLYNDDALQGSIRITIAEPLEHREMVAREIQIGLGLAASDRDPCCPACHHTRGAGESRHHCAAFGSGWRRAMRVICHPFRQRMFLPKSRRWRAP